MDDGGGGVADSAGGILLCSRFRLTFVALKAILCNSLVLVLERKVLTTAVAYSDMDGDLTEITRAPALNERDVSRQTHSVDVIASLYAAATLRCKTNIQP